MVENRDFRGGVGGSLKIGVCVTFFGKWGSKWGSQNMDKILWAHMKIVLQNERGVIEEVSTKMSL